MSDHDLHDLFDREVPLDAQRGIIKAIEAGYRLSDEACKRDYDERLWPQAWGYLRWLHVDSALLGVGDRHGKVGRFPKNTKNTHIGHTELTFGQLVLTAACIPSRGSKPRAAVYRELLAESNQLQLFERQAKKNKLWCVILHIPNTVTHLPLHIYVGFVTAEYKFAGPLLDLVKHVEAKTAATPASKLRLRKQEDVGG